MFTTASIVVIGCVSGPEPHFAAHYSGGVHDAHMDLDVLRGLPERGTTGWLVSAEQSQADARFSGGSGGPPKFRLEPTFVKFSTERSEKYPAAYFHWEGDAFIVCMKYVQFGTATDSGKLALTYDYSSYCARMRPAAG